MTDHGIPEHLLTDEMRAALEDARVAAMTPAEAGHHILDEHAKEQRAELDRKTSLAFLRAERDAALRAHAFLLLRSAATGEPLRRRLDELDERGLRVLAELAVVALRLAREVEAELVDGLLNALEELHEPRIGE